MKLLMLGTWEIVIIALLVVLLFGGKKIPELMKGLGKGVRSFRDGLNGKVDDTPHANDKDNAASHANDNADDTAHASGKDK